MKKKSEMAVVVQRGPHPSERTPNAIAALREESTEKYEEKKFRLISWEGVQENPPPQLNIPPGEEIPHKRQKFIAILNFSIN